MVLSRDSGELTYVNAGHNPPDLAGSGSVSFLPATGMPLGLFADAPYEDGAAAIPPGGVLLLYTDGLTDSMRADNPHERLREALGGPVGGNLAALESLIDPKLNEDDATLLLLKRTPDLAPGA